MVVFTYWHSVTRSELYTLFLIFYDDEGKSYFLLSLTLSLSLSLSTKETVGKNLP